MIHRTGENRYNSTWSHSVNSISTRTTSSPYTISTNGNILLCPLSKDGLLFSRIAWVRTAFNDHNIYQFVEIDKNRLSCTKLETQNYYLLKYLTRLRDSMNQNLVFNITPTFTCTSLYILFHDK